MLTPQIVMRSHLHLRWHTLHRHNLHTLHMPEERSSSISSSSLSSPSLTHVTYGGNSLTPSVASSAFGPTGLFSNSSLRVLKSMNGLGGVGWLSGTSTKDVSTYGLSSRCSTGRGLFNDTERLLRTAPRRWWRLGTSCARGCDGDVVDLLVEISRCSMNAAREHLSDTYVRSHVTTTCFLDLFFLLVIIRCTTWFICMLPSRWRFVRVRLRRLARLRRCC